MSVKFGNEVLYIGETFATEAVDKWSDLTEYYALSLHEGKVVRTKLGTNFSGKLAEVVIDATPAIKKALDQVERDKKAKNKREYNEYAWREAKKLGLHRSEWESIRFVVSYYYRHLVEMLVELDRRGDLEGIGYETLLGKIFDALKTHDLDAFVAIGNDPKNDHNFYRLTRYAEKVLFGD